MNGALKQNIELVRNLYQVEITEIEKEEDAAAFSRRHLLHPLQVPMTADGILLMRQSADPGGIYILEDIFLMKIAVFFLQGNFLILGPVTEVLFSQRDAAEILRDHGLREITVHDLLLYRESYPNLSEGALENILSALIRVLDPDSEERVIRKSEDMVPQSRRGDVDASAAERPHYAAMLEKRYAAEQKFIEAVKRGNAREALACLQEMQADVSYLKRIGTTLENERTGAAITRTTVRLASLEAGVPPLLSDQISMENTRRSMNARTVTEILKAKEEMVRTFCQAVRESREGRHSALGQSAVYYLEHEYGREIRLDEMASDLETSKGHLIEVFRKEYGITPVEYLNHYRMQQAARLLSGTSRSVQEIAGLVGVPDANYFCKLFRKEYGQTPTAYRRQRSTRPA